MYDAVDVSYGTFYFGFGLSYLLGGFAVVVAVPLAPCWLCFVGLGGV